MGNKLCCPTKKDGGSSGGGADSNNTKQSAQSRKYETTEAQELSVHSPIVNGAEMPVDVPDTMLVGKDENGELRFHNISMPEDGGSVSYNKENPAAGSSQPQSVGLVNPGFSSDEDEEEKQAKTKKIGHDTSSEGTGELSRQSTVKVRADDVPDYINQSKVKVKTTEVKVKASHGGTDGIDMDFNSDTSMEIERSHHELFGGNGGVSGNAQGDTSSIDSDTYKTADNNFDSDGGKSGGRTHAVVMSAADMHTVAQGGTEEFGSTEAAVTSTEIHQPNHHHLPSLNTHVVTDDRLQQELVDQGYLIVGGATGAQESTDDGLLDNDEVKLDFDNQGSRPDSTFDLFGGPASGPEEMYEQDSIQFSIDSVWARTQNDDDRKSDDDTHQPRFEEPTLEEFEEAERNAHKEVSLDALTNNPADKDKLLSSQTIGSQRIDYALPQSDIDSNIDANPNMDSNAVKPDSESSVPSQPLGIQGKSAMYGADSESESDSDTDSYVTTQSANEAAIKAETAGAKDHRGSFDLFGTAPHRDMPTKPFPVIVDAELVAKTEQEIESESVPRAFEAFPPQTSQSSPEHITVNREARKKYPPLQRSPQVSEEATDVLLGLDEALDEHSAEMGVTGHAAEARNNAQPNQTVGNATNPSHNVTEDGLRIIHDDLRPHDDLQARDDLRHLSDPRGPGLLLPASGNPHPDPDFTAESDEEDEDEDYDDELNLVMKDGAIVDANQTDEADRELEEIIMDIEVIEDSFTSDLLTPGFMEDSEEELGMHVMSQLAQLADLRDLLLNRQPAPPPPMDAIPAREFLSEDQIEEWYVSEVGKVNDWCAVQILRQKFVENNLGPETIASVLQEHRSHQERYRAIRDVAREQLGEDLRDQLKERNHPYPSGNYSSDEEEEEEDDESASECSYNVEVNQQSLAEEMGQSSGIPHNHRHEDIMLSGYKALQNDEHWGASGVPRDIEEDDIAMDLNYAVPYTDPGTASQGIMAKITAESAQNFSAIQQVQANTTPMTHTATTTTTVDPNSANPLKSQNTAVNTSALSTEASSQQSHPTSVPKIITPAQPVSSSSDSSDVDEELKLADLMLNPIGEKTPDSDSDSEDIKRQYGALVESTEFAEPLPSDHESEASEEDEEDCDPELSTTLKDTLKADIRSSLHEMTSEQFHALMDTYRDERKGLKDLREGERDRIQASLWTKLNNRKNRDSNLNPVDEEENQTQEFGAQTEGNNNTISVATTTNPDAEVLKELHDLDQDFIASACTGATDDAAFQALLREHVESTEFLRQQKQKTLLHHKAALQQKLKEKQAKKELSGSQPQSGLSSSSSESSDEDETLEPYTLRTRDEQIEKQLEANTARLLSSAHVGGTVSEADVAALLREHRERQAAILAQREEMRRQMHERVRQKLMQRQASETGSIASAVGKMDEEFYQKLMRCHADGEIDDEELERLVEEHLEKVDAFKHKVHRKMQQMRQKRAARAKQDREAAKDEASHLLQMEREQARQIARIRETEKQHANTKLQEKLNKKKQEQEYSTSPALPGPRRPPREYDSPQHARRHNPTAYENVDLL